MSEKGGEGTCAEVERVGGRPHPSKLSTRALVDQEREAEAKPFHPLACMLRRGAEEVDNREGKLVRRDAGVPVARHHDVGLLLEATVLRPATEQSTRRV